MIDAPDAGAGVYRVRIGFRRFTCLRVIDLRAADESEEAGVAFVERSGRTVLYRQYRGRAINPDWHAWRAAHPGRELVINGSLFLQRSSAGHCKIETRTDPALGQSEVTGSCNRRVRGCVETGIAVHLEGAASAQLLNHPGPQRRPGRAVRPLRFRHGALAGCGDLGW
jgi:hypothetical protein